MNETPGQYTQRIVGYVQDGEPLVVQAETAKKLERLIKGVSLAKLRRRPAPGKWSVSEIVAHLADAEIVGGYRLRLILGSPGAPIVAYNQDEWVTSGHYHKRDPRKSVALFRALREGYEVFPVTDAIGGTSPEAHRAGLDRVMQAGGQPIGWVSLAGELQRDWGRQETSGTVYQIVVGDRLAKEQ